MSAQSLQTVHSVLQLMVYLPDFIQAPRRLKGLLVSTIKMAKTLQSS